MQREIAEARASAERSLERCRTKASSAGMGAAIGAAGLGVGANTMGKQQYLTMAAEQYRHFQGWVQAIIRTIAFRIAGQPFKVARIVTDSEQRRLERVIAKGGDRGEKARRRLKHIRANRPSEKALPGHLKAQARKLEVLDGHEILRILSKPNPLMTAWHMIYTTVASLELTGCGYWWFVQDDQVSVGGRKWDGYQIWPIPSSWVEPIHEEDQLFAAWEITPPGGGQTLRVPGWQVGRMYYPDPSNPIGQLSPLYCQSRAVVVDEAALEAQRRGFANGMWPGMAFIVGRDPDIAGGLQGQRPVLTREQRAQLMAAVKQAYRGVQNSEEPLILDGFITDVKSVTTSNRNMAFMDTAKMSKERLSQGWGVNPVSMGQLEGANRACHDDKTELLTTRGWLRYDEVAVGDIAATMNPDTGRFEWQAVQQVRVYHDYSGPMVRLSGMKIDALMTPDHRMWSRRGQKSGKATPDSKYGFKPASDLKTCDVLPLSPLPQIADNVGVFRIPGVKPNAKRSGNGSEIDALVWMDPFLEFIGWFVSEGWTVSHLNKRTGRHTHTVGIKQAVGGVEECEKILSCMELLEIQKVHVYKTRAFAALERNDGYARQASNTYAIVDKRLWKWLRKNCGVGSANKRLPDFLFRLPAEQVVRTLDALLLGDGSHRVATAEKGYTNLHAMYASTSKKLMDQVQALAVLCGRAARMRRDNASGIHTMGISEYSREMFLYPKHISREQYTGVVWCATVQNGLLVTRRNGKTLVSGNSSATADEHLLLNVINPRLEMISQILTRWLPPLVGAGEDIICYFEPAHTYDREQDRQDVMALLDRGVISRNEVRAMEGRPPVEDGDSAFVPNYGEVPVLSASDTISEESRRSPRTRRLFLPVTKTENGHSTNGHAQ